MSEHPGIARFRAEHERLGGTGRIVTLAAQALGCEVGAIANSLLFDSGEGPVLVLTSGGHRVDVTATAARIGVPRLKRASPDFVREHTGQVIGGVSPLAHPAPVPTSLDRHLATFDEIWAAAGHPAAVFSTTYAELLAMTGATEVHVGPEDASA